MKPQVLHLQYNKGQPGGIEVFIASIMNELDECYFGAYYNIASARFYETPEEIITLDTHDNTRRGGLFRLFEVIRQWRPDIIHMHWPPAIMYGQIARILSFSPAKTVAHFHGMVGLPSNVYSPLHPRRVARYCLQSYCIRNSDVLIACSHEIKRAAAAYWRLDTERITILGNPVDVDRWRIATPDPLLRTSLGIEEEDVLLVFVGRLSIGVKGLDVLCRTLSLIGPDLHVKLAIIGPGNPSTLREYIMDPSRVIFIGPIAHEQLPSILKACDVYIQPSRYEGLPLTVLEAMAAGLPVIATRVGGIPEAVKDGITGILVEPEDPKALAEAIQWMVEHPAEREEMGRRGKERAKLFDMHTIAARLKDIYQGILNDG